MPRFHFNIQDEGVHLDVDGIDLRDVSAAKFEGLRMVGEIIRNAGMRAEPLDEWRLEVTDRAGLILFRMEFTIVESPAVSAATGPLTH